jgi:outer membrane immunogenic protein
MKFGFQKLCVAFAAVAALAGSANAADMYTKARPAPLVEMYNWTGFYVGGEIGYMSGDLVSNCPGGICAARSVDSVVGGVQAGYNWQAPGSNWVLGLWANVPIVPVKLSDVAVLPGAFNAEIQWAFAGGARVGYAMGRFMPFVMAGGVVAGARAQNNLILPGVWEEKTHTGYTVGGGVEYALDRNWSTHIRYAYADMSKESYPIVYAPTETHGMRIHNTVIGINYRFGGPVVAKY